MPEEKEVTPMKQATPEEIQAVLSGGSINDIAEASAIKPEEKPAAEVIDDKPTDTLEVVAPVDGGEKPKEEPEGFNIEFFNKQFSTEYKDESGIKEALEALKKNEGLQTQVDTIPSLQEELEILRGEADPMKYFASEDDFRVAQFKKEFPSKDPAMVARLFSTDLSQANDFDLLTWMTMLDNPNLKGGESGARELVADFYGVENPSDLTDIDTITANKLMVNASKERTRLSEMKDGIKLPEKKDYATVLEQRKADQATQLEESQAGWNTLSEAVVKDYPDVVIQDTDAEGNVTEFFRYPVGKDMTEEIVKPVVDGFVKAGIPIDEQSAKALGIAIQKEFISKNYDKILRAAVKDKMANKEEEVLEEEHNTKKPNDSERPKDGGGDLAAKMMADIKGGGMTVKRAV